MLKLSLKLLLIFSFLTSCSWVSFITSKSSLSADSISFETSSDGSGQKLTQFSLTDSAVKTLYAVGYNANGVRIGPVVGTWTITEGTNASLVGSNIASSTTLQGLSVGAVKLKFESSFANKEMTVSIEASPIVNFKFANLNYFEYGLLELELELNQAVASEIDVGLTAPTGTAIAGTHFVAFPSSVKIPAGQTSYKFYAPVIRDYARTNTEIKCWGYTDSGVSTLTPTAVSQVSVANAKSIYYSGQLCIYNSDSHLAFTSGSGSGTYTRAEFSSRWAQQMPTP